MKTKARMLSVTLLVAALAIPATASAQEFKLATLAPGKSSWMKIFRRAAKEIKEATGGKVTFKIYGGGRQGDEKVAVEKIKAGQLHAAAITAVGLAEIAPEVLILQAPGLITGYKELDKVRGKLEPKFEKAMESAGFVLGGWGDVGEVDYFSNEPINLPEDLKKSSVKMWIWNADPIAREVAKVLGVRGVPRGVPDVLPSLTSGNINTLYSSALACLQLQWCNHMKYRTSEPVAVGIGAIVFSKKALDQLSPEHRKIVLDSFRKWSKALTRKIRVDNAKARKLLELKKGMKVTEIDASEMKTWLAIGRKVQDALVGKIYSQALLDEVRGILGK